jgi:hypothetical protein
VELAQPRATSTKKKRGIPRRAFTITLAAALILHVPLIPWYFGEWLRLAFFSAVDDPDDPDAQAIIPIDLDLLAEDPTAEAPAEPAAAPPPSPAAADDTARDPMKKPDGEGPAADAGPLDDAAAPPDAGRPAAPAAASGQADAGPPLRDPMSAAGGAGKVAAKDPNVQVLMAGNVIRKHELGAAISRILVLIPEWQPFFEGSPIDPIRDVNHVLITAPSFRSGFGKMVAIMDFNVAEPMIRGAVDLVVQRTEGEWLEDTPIPTARVKVAESDRLFALPGKRLLVVLPLEAKDQLAELQKTQGFRNSSAGLVISMVTPAGPLNRVLSAANFARVPDTLKWMRVAVTPTANGGVDVALEFGDKSKEDAALHAPELTETFNSVVDGLDGLVNLMRFFGRLEHLEHATFEPEGDTLKARVHITGPQLKGILGLVEGWLKTLPKRGAAAAPRPPSAPEAPEAPGTAAPKASP